MSDFPSSRVSLYASSAMILRLFRSRSVIAICALLFITAVYWLYMTQDNDNCISLLRFFDINECREFSSRSIDNRPHCS